MISKHVSMRAPQKSHLADLVRYITQGQGRQERVGLVSITHCHSLEAEDAVREMLAVQACNTRSMDCPSYHLLVSFASGEHPSASVLRAIESRLCEALGFGEHQRVSAVHHDTDHLHIHIAINKVHPVRHTIHTPYRDFRILGQTSQDLEREFGLVQIDHASQRTVAQGRAADMEHQAGIESLMSWTRRTCLPGMAAATSWAEVHRVLDAHQLVLRPRGNGLVIMTGAGLRVKASSVDRCLGKAQLEARLGPFQAATVERVKAARSQYQARPIGYPRTVSDLFLRYQAERQAGFMHGQASRQQAVKQRAAAFVSLQRRSARRRALIRLLPAGERRMLYLLARGAMGRERAAIQRAYQHARHDAAVRYPQLTWADWLRLQADRGDALALQALRQRDMTSGPVLQVPPLRGRASPVGRVPPCQRTGRRVILRRILGKPPVPSPGDRPPQGLAGRWRWLSSLRSLVQLGVAPLAPRPGSAAHPEPSEGDHAHEPVLRKDSTTRRGTQIFRAGATAIRDDGRCLRVSRGASDAGLYAALTAAVQRYGHRLKVEGSDVFKQALVRVAAQHAMPLCFVDPVMEQDRRSRVPTEGDAYAERTERRGTDRRNAGRTGSPPGGGSIDGTCRSDRQSGRAGGGQPDPAAADTRPAAPGPHRVRDLPQLGVVHHPDGGEVLLPGDVSDQLEQPGSHAVHGLRRPVHRAGELTAEAAAAAYMAGREALRGKGVAIPKHRRFSDGDAGIFRYAGVRQVEDQSMVLLLAADDTVLVLPITAMQRPRMLRRPIGERVKVSTQGAIRSAGRGQGAGA